MTGTTTTTTRTTTRAHVHHTPQWQRFQTSLMAASHQVAAVSLQGKATKDKQAPVQVHPYQRQYAHVYHERYQQLAPLCWQAVQAAEEAEQQSAAATNNDNNDDNKPRHVARILELPEGLEALVVGTLVRESLPANNNNNNNNNKEDDLLVANDSDCRASDALFLEDDSGRVALEIGNQANSHRWPSGAVLAVRGTLGVDGVLLVTHVVPPGAAVATPRPISTTTTATPHYLLLVSGVDCGHASVPSTTRDLLLSFVQGHLRDEKAPFVARVLVAGGLVAERSTTTTTTKQALQEADAWLDQLVAAGVPVDVVPAAADPTTANWPQRPLHGSLLPRASRRAPGLFRRAPNPYQASYQVVHDVADDDTTAVTVVATDGLNVRAQQRVTLVGGRRPTVLEVMAQHVVGRHLCPVGPSIVPTAPHALQDPMVLGGDAPHLYVTGGAPAFGTQRTAQGTRLVAVPSFGASGTAVLVDLNSSNLAVQLVRFVDEAL